MMDHSENTLRAAIKSLREVVAPAVAKTDAQAVEQLRLTIDFLEFLRSRLYDIHARHRFELKSQIEVAQSLLDPADALPDRAGDRLRAAVTEAVRVHGDPDAHTEELRVASQMVWGTVRGVVRVARDGPQEPRQRVSLAVVQGVAALVELESAWYAPFGLEPDPAAIPQLSSLLGGESTAGAM